LLKLPRFSKYSLTTTALLHAGSSVP
jgi:hypothetical protein